MNKDQKREKAKAHEYLDKQAKIGQWARSEDWRNVKRELFKRIIEITSVTNILDSYKKRKPSIEKFGENAYINAKVEKVILDWISDIEGTKASLHENLMEMAVMRKETLLRFDEDGNQM